MLKKKTRRNLLEFIQLSSDTSPNPKFYNKKDPGTTMDKMET